MKSSRKKKRISKKKKSKGTPRAERKSIADHDCNVNDRNVNDRNVNYVVSEYLFTGVPGRQAVSGCPSLSVSGFCPAASDNYRWQRRNFGLSISVSGCLFVIPSVPALALVSTDADFNLGQEANISGSPADTGISQQAPSDVSLDATGQGRRDSDRLLVSNFSVTSDGLQDRENYPSDAVFQYVQEQLKLNEVRTGFNLVSPERTEHILRGDPKLKTVVLPSENGLVVQTVQEWSGGHSNPQAAQQYKKTQKPFFWTDERFMYEISDILVSPETNWTPQGDGLRYVCVEERSGVPIKLVAEIPDKGQISCITAYPAQSVLRIKK